MNNYKYVSRTIDGQQVKGVIKAESESEFFGELKKNNLFLESYSVSAVSQSVARMHRMKTKELVIFCRKFGTMIEAGLTITSALEIMYQSAEKPRVREVYLSMYENLQTGMSLSETMRACTGSFSNFFISMVESGEESGSLDKVFLRLSAHYDKENRLHANIITAVTYPTILLCLSFVIIIVLFTLILPDLFVIFKDSELPGVTKAMIAISNFFVLNWYWVIIGVLSLIAGIKALAQVPAVAVVFGRLKLKLPIMGKMNLMIYTSRFARSIAMLYSSGISILTTMGISVNTLNNAFVAKRFAIVLDLVMSGESLSEALRQADIFDGMFLSMIRVGGEASNLDDVLEHTADFYDIESDVAVKRMITLLEPLLLVILGAIIALVLVSVMLPIYQMYQGIA
jgi:type IV pilus assembly protein PilC